MITNTSKQVKDEPLLGLCLLSIPGGKGIEEQERNGQEELCQSGALPTDCDEHCQKALEKAGVVFGEPVRDYPLFRHVNLPDGWKIKASVHSLWSDLLDEKGRIRALIFYKAAFYDLRAFFKAVRFYNVVDLAFEREKEDGVRESEYVVRDGNGEIVYRGKKLVWHLTDSEDLSVFYNKVSEERHRVENWLGAHYGSHYDAGCYWD